MDTHSTTIPIWTTTIGITSVGIPAAAHRAALDDTAFALGHWDALFNRFYAGSMLSQLNRAAGCWFSTDPTFCQVLDTARDGVFATGGRFDPAILPALEAAGYTRSLDHPAARPTAPIMNAVVIGPAAWEQVDIDHRRHRVRLPPGMRIDLSGIVKGALADTLADRFMAWPGGAISIGGDLRLWGAAPDASAWQVGVEHPRDPGRDIATITIDHPAWRALATSTPRKRAWRTDTGDAHHLIDPRTRQPAITPCASVTCCAITAVAAEIATKALLLSTAQPARREPVPGLLWALAIPVAGDMMVIRNEVHRCDTSAGFFPQPFTHPNPRSVSPRSSLSLRRHSS